MYTLLRYREIYICLEMIIDMIKLNLGAFWNGLLIQLQVCNKLWVLIPCSDEILHYEIEPLCIERCAVVITQYRGAIIAL